MPATKVRDPFLDCAKGIAIVVVVISHYYQFNVPGFEDDLIFRMICSFQMPCFFFISGMVTANWFGRFIELRSPGTVRASLAKDIASKARRLLFPFITWACIGYLLAWRDTLSIWQWVELLARQPDYSLWFILILFEMNILLYVAALLVLLVSAYGNRAATGLQRIALIVVAGLLTYLAIKAVPLQGLGLLKVHYPNFFAGLVFFYWMRGRFPVLGYVAACAVFVTIAPFWHRLHPLELTNGLAFGGQIDRSYNLAVALSGTLTALGGARLAATKLKGPALAAVTFVGKRSLDIYALHFYLLAIWPLVAGAILASLSISAVLRLNRWSSIIFFGEPASSEADRLAPKPA